MTLTPAYGRDYKSKKAVLADFEADKDFIISGIRDKWESKPVNKSQLKETGVKSVNIRYRQNTRVIVVPV
jgi:hypothetical protein